MKKLLSGVLSVLLLVSVCACRPQETVQIAATTLPVFEFTTRICEGTGISVGRLVTESVSCLHDYSLQVSQMRMIESADTIVISGGGLEDFLDDALQNRTVIDSSQGLVLICPEEHAQHDEHAHHHETDPHYWLSPACAQKMAHNICEGLCTKYPEHENTFHKNSQALISELQALQNYGEQTLDSLSSRKIITFHDGFSYFADSFGLTIVKAIEEESGQEASAAELKELIALVREHNLPAVFTETNGSVSAAEVISVESGCALYSLDMVMSGNSYFTAMYHNIDTVKEALG